MSNDIFFSPNPKPICGGTGLIALDVIMNGSSITLPKLWSGGSCGNVLIILSYLGWESFAVARLGKDPAADIIRDDFQRFNVRYDFVENDEKTPTAVIVESIRRSKGGYPTHRFLLTCPKCGKWLPRYRPVLLNRINHVIPSLPIMDCFYFDRVSAGTLELAKHARKTGALVVYEPPRIKNKDMFKKAVEVSHVVKYAHDPTGSMQRILEKSSVLLVIETLGSKGLRYILRAQREKKNNWEFLPAYIVTDLRDAAGAGDWCTAGIIHVLGRGGAAACDVWSEKKIIKALQFGQALAAVNCRFEGARGGMYGFDKERLQRAVTKIMKAEEAEDFDPVDSVDDKGHLKTVCPGCNGSLKDSTAAVARETSEAYFVKSCSDSGWYVKRQDASRVSSKHPTKAQAVARAKELAQRSTPVRVVIYRKDGSIQSEKIFR